MKSLRRAWVAACRKAGRPGLLPHDLRRSTVRNLERAGISRSVAITEAVYRRYAIVAESDPREAGAKLTVRSEVAKRQHRSVTIWLTIRGQRGMGVR